MTYARFQVVLWMVFATLTTGCTKSGVGGACLSVEETALLDFYGELQYSFCIQAHQCRVDFPISDADFEAQFGTTVEECRFLPWVPFVETVRSRTSGGDAGPGSADAGPGSTETDLKYRLIDCGTALARETCAEVVSDVLLQDGNYCGTDVLNGLAPCPANLIGECVRPCR